MGSFEWNKNIYYSNDFCAILFTGIICKIYERLLNCEELFPHKNHLWYKNIGFFHLIPMKISFIAKCIIKYFTVFTKCRMKLRANKKFEKKCKKILRKKCIRS